ncbi:heptaprenyl diphosphate synthase component 1 [Lentibacillus juripiscarius]|uniref:heptaprenyl diphosphate synthase component 1 n=1 Tax=Lentibacillus juripiscarius TaxID=257446 RepID=UPI0036D3EBBC
MLQTSSIEINSVKALIHEKIHNSLIEKHVQIPYLNDDKLYILISILNNTPLPDAKKKNYIIATMLVQMALDIHDGVPETNECQQHDDEEKSKQLSVLAGDYYSSLYYLLLSEVEEIELIGVLAAAIKEINETKMQLYYKMNNEMFPLTMQHIKKLESLLIIRVADFTGETLIRDIAAEWLAVRKLAAARCRRDRDNNVMSSDIWDDHIANKDHQAIASFLKREIKAINNHLIQFPAHLAGLGAELKDTLNESLSDNESIAEEGK